MNTPNAKDPLEKLLGDQPLDQVPAGVYERLQAKAVWNTPTATRWPMLVGMLVVLVMVAVALFMPLPQPHPEPPMPEPAAPIIVPAPSAPVVAIVPPLPQSKNSDDLVSQIGGLSSRLMTDEPPFDLGFGSASDLSSSRLEALES